MSDYREVHECRLCSAELPETPVLDLGSTPLANVYPQAPIAGGQRTYPLALLQCSACGHVQLSVAVKPELLFPDDYPYCSGTSPVFREHLKEFARTVSGMLSHEPYAPNIFEIGCNDGTLLNEFIRLHCWAHGIDPAAPPLQTHENEGGKFFHGFFSHAWAKQLRSRWARHPNFPGYDAIVALNVFAHVDDLNDFTAGVAELLAPDGVFVFEVGYLPEVLDKFLLGCVYHEHLSYHELWPLVPFFQRHGLCLFDAHEVDSQGGSIRCFVSREHTLPSEDMRRLLCEEDPGEHYDLWQFGRAIECGKRDVVARIRELQAAGKRVAAFGAPAKLTTWSYALGLGPDDITKVYDDNPLKIGRHTPGNFWEIVPSSQLLIDQPDAVVLFSSNFEAEIRERFKAYRGEWIVV